MNVITIRCFIVICGLGFLNLLILRLALFPFLCLTALVLLFIVLVEIFHMLEILTLVNLCQDISTIMVRHLERLLKIVPPKKKGPV